MTTLVKARGLPSGFEHRSSEPAGTRSLLERLREESVRQIPFSETRLLLRRAMEVIERLEGELSRISADLDRERRSSEPGTHPGRDPQERGRQ